MSIRVTALDADILRALARFTYCTIPQLAQILGAKNENSVKHALQRMRAFSRPLVKKWEYAFIAGVGRLHSVSTLTHSGANVLAEVDRIDVDSIYFPALGVQYSRDYLHRRAFVDCHIAIDHWARSHEAEIAFFDRYFLAEGGNHTNPNSLNGADALVRREYQTRIVLPAQKILIPDGIFLFHQGGKSRLCALEIHQGHETKKILAQLEQHIHAIEGAAVRRKYGRDEANFVLSVYEHRETMEAVMKRFSALPDYPTIRLSFHFATVEAVKADVRTAWCLASGEAVTIFR
jgi:hypothetical protein